MKGNGYVCGTELMDILASPGVMWNIKKVEGEGGSA
jgi:hypothetical protein